MLVSVGERWKCEYLGYFAYCGITTRFHSSCLFSSPFHHSNARASLCRLLVHKLVRIGARLPSVISLSVWQGLGLEDDVPLLLTTRFTYVRCAFEEEARQRRLENQMPTAYDASYRNTDSAAGVEQRGPALEEEYDHAHRSDSGVLWGTSEDPIDGMVLR